MSERYFTDGAKAVAMSLRNTACRVVVADAAAAVPDGGKEDMEKEMNKNERSGAYAKR